MAGTVTSRLVLLIALPLLSRMYSPDQIGVWFLVASAAMILATVASLRYELAIMLPEDDEKSFQILRICFWLNLLSSVAVFTAVFVCRTQIAQLIGFTGPPAYLLAVSLLMPLSCGTEICASWLGRKNAFRRIAGARLCDAVSMTAVQLLLGMLFAPNAIFLLVGMLIGQVCGFSVAVISVLSTRPTSVDLGLSVFRLPDWEQVKGRLTEYRYYPIYMTPYTFVGVLCKRLVPFILAIYATTQLVGHFAMAYQLAYMPINVIGRSIGQAFYPKVARSIGSKNLDQFVLRILYYLSVLALPPLVLLAFHAKWLVALLLGPDWEPTATYVVMLAVPCFTQLLSSWLDRVYDAAGRQRLAVMLQLGYDFISISLFVVVLHFGSSYAAIAVYCSTVAIYNLTWLTVTFHVAGFPRDGLVRTLLMAALFAGTLGCCHGLLAKLIPHSGMALGVGFLLNVCIQVYLAMPARWNLARQGRTEIG